MIETLSPLPLPIGVASSGLGHIHRGIETWALSVAEGLHAAGAPTRLFGGGPCPPSTQVPFQKILNLPRESRVLTPFLNWHRRYHLEQLSFAWFLKNDLRRNPIQALLVSDPALSLKLHRWRTRYPFLPPVIHKDGLLLGPLWCRHFQYSQVLAPHYKQEAEKSNIPSQNCFTIPHMVNPVHFRPVAMAEKLILRKQWIASPLPPEAKIVLSVGDFSSTSNKRLDWIIEEIARIPKPHSIWLALAGHATPKDLQRLQDKGSSMLQDRLLLFPNTPPNKIKELYQLSDLYAHGALKEPFGIVFLEAMACGLPLIGHVFPVTQWIIGEAGASLDMERPGELSQQIQQWIQAPDTLLDLSKKARSRAISTFSQDVILPRYQEMFEKVRQMEALRP